ncbi:MAG: signal peptide peptidase SppA [Cyanobacteria bacterium J06635_15]
MRDFLKYATASAVGTIVGLIVLMTLLGVSIVGFLGFIVATASRDVDPEIEDPSMLVFDLSVDITDSIPPSRAEIALEEAISGQSNQSISIYSAIQTLEAAAEDNDIVGLYLQGNTLEGLATLSEIRIALEKFQTSGKPIIAYNVGWSERDYYLTSVADNLMLNPAGIIELNGFSVESQFLAGALEKYGIGVQVLQAGRYKSAVEPFIRTESSPESQEQTRALINGLWQDFLGKVAGARDLETQQLQQIANQGGLLMADEAQAAGLVDKVAHFDEVLAELRSLTDADPRDDEVFPQVGLVEYSRIVNQRQDDGWNDDVVAVVYAEGEITGGESGPGVIGSVGLSRQLRELREDDEIDAIVLRVNSPGGGARASEIISREVQLASEAKPLVVSMADLAASGGYMISTHADKIYALPSTITGSIGVFGLILNLQDIANDNGITWDVIKTAEFADINTIARPQSDAELQLQQGIVNQLYDRFITMVAESREIPKTRVDEIAQGRVWLGNDAAERGLVNELGGLEDAIASAAAAAELDDWTVEEYPKPLSLEEQILENFFSQLTSRLPGGKDPLSQEFLKLREQLRVLELMQDPNGVYLRLPFTTEID